MSSTNCKVLDLNLLPLCDRPVILKVQQVEPSCRNLHSHQLLLTIDSSIDLLLTASSKINDQVFGYQKKYDKAMAMYLKLGHKDVFQLIRRYCYFVIMTFNFVVFGTHQQNSNTIAICSTLQFIDISSEQYLYKMSKKLSFTNEVSE